jgi:hypothetical protein
MKGMWVACCVAGRGSRLRGHPRGEIMDATGTAWFNHRALTEGAEDGSLTVTGGDQTLEVMAK